MNLRTAYAHGQWQKIECVAEARPYLRYIGVLDARIRPEHRAWHGIDPGWAHNVGLRDQGIESRTMI